MDSLKQTAHKTSSGKAPNKKQSCFGGKTPKKSDEVITCPESVENVLSFYGDNKAFIRTFTTFLRIQKDKNTSLDFTLKYEERLHFAGLVKGASEEERNNRDSYSLPLVGQGFCNIPKSDRLILRTKWTHDLFDGFGEAKALITHLTDLYNTSRLMPSEPANLLVSTKEVNKDLVDSAYRWVVEDLEEALVEFKVFRDALDEKEMRKWDNLAEELCEKLNDYDSGDLSFEKFNAISKELHKELNHIIARYNNQNKDIDSLVELIEGKPLGAIPKQRKENSSKSKKKKNSEIKCKNVIEQAESEGNIARQQSDEKFNQFKSEMSPVHNKVRASLYNNTNIDGLENTTKEIALTKDQLEELRNRLREEESKNSQLNQKLTLAYQENDLLRSKLLQKDFKKFQDVLRQRQKNTLSLIDNLRASPELKNTTEVHLALRSLLEFSARLVLAGDQLATEYATLSQQLQTNKTIKELHLDMSNIEPPDLGSSSVNLLYKSILMNHSSTASFTQPQISRSTTSSPLQSNVQDSTLVSRGAGTGSSHHRTGSFNCNGSADSFHSNGSATFTKNESAASFAKNESAASFANNGSAASLTSNRSAASLASNRSAASSNGSAASFHMDGSVDSFPRNGSAGSFHSNKLTGSLDTDGAATTSRHPGGTAAISTKPRPDLSKVSSKTNKKAIKFMERSGGGARVNSEDDSCVICFEEMHKNDSFYLKSCWHRFHTACMQQWLASPGGVASTCPICRRNIVEKDDLHGLGSVMRF